MKSLSEFASWTILIGLLVPMLLAKTFKALIFKLWNHNIVGAGCGFTLGLVVLVALIAVASARKSKVKTQISVEVGAAALCAGAPSQLSATLKI